jgi:hypothetical protein
MGHLLNNKSFSAIKAPSVTITAGDAFRSNGKRSVWRQK